MIAHWYHMFLFSLSLSLSLSFITTNIQFWDTLRNCYAIIGCVYYSQRLSWSAWYTFHLRNSPRCNYWYQLWTDRLLVFVSNRSSLAGTTASKCYQCGGKGDRSCEESDSFYERVKATFTKSPFRVDCFSLDILGKFNSTTVVCQKTSVGGTLANGFINSYTSAGFNESLRRPIFSYRVRIVQIMQMGSEMRHRS